MNTPTGDIIRDLVFKPASARERASGLLGWISGRLACGLKVDGIAVRKTLAGELRLSFPERRDASGRSHPYLRPADDETRRRFEAEVFLALGMREDLAS